ncbi:xeroderma pigmentosum group C-complementing protein [Strigomonas culicis]|nr:xeroderma pigmentosum group C-complementing protein [Strigomonas culicis]|eukprot:EPY29356.1 xeroderma pigmentosum group C-complementing protein [Strigomonas culicis]
MPEGGRGTRRRLALVTSNVAQQQEQTEAMGAEDATDVVDADEWDEVDLNIVDSTVGQRHPTKTEDTVVKKVDEAEGDQKRSKKEAMDKIVEDVDAPVLLKTEGGLSWDGHAGDTLVGRQQPYPIEGARAPLTEQPQRTWRRSDPAFEAAAQQRELQAAQRRSQRIQAVSESIVVLQSVLLRGRFVWREARHPKFRRLLLYLRRQVECPQEREVATSKRSKVATAKMAPRSANETRFVFLDALNEARHLLRTEPLRQKSSLAPAWVTLAKDGVGNRTSRAVTVLLKALNDTFELDDAGGAQGEGGEVENKVSHMSDWAYPLKHRLLTHLLYRVAQRPLAPAEKVKLPHTVYFSVLFLSLASMIGLSARLVIAKEVTKVVSVVGDESDDDVTAVTPAAEAPADDTDTWESHKGGRKLPKLSIFAGRSSKKATSKRARTDSPTAEGDQRRSKHLPTSCFWTEVWSPERSSFVSVNPCGGCTTLWGAPYTFSFSGDTVVDATPRYITKYSSAFHYGQRLDRANHFSFLWRDKVAWDDTREVSEILVDSMNAFTAHEEHHLSALTREQRARDAKQLHSLMYSEPVPTTITGVQKHPLFVMESQVARFEGVYPKDATTIVGSVKGQTVYKRSAVVMLRSRDGWLREGRSLIDEEAPAYKTMAPPASRPFAAPSLFYGFWQTKPFAPLPLTADGTFPQHGRTAWYVLLDRPPADGIVHLREPRISRVARRMRLDFRIAVTGFVKRRVDERRRGQWEAVIEGIVVKQSDSPSLLRAYREWIQLVEEQEAAARRERSFRWWLLFSQRLLAMKRLQDLYLKGGTHGLAS